jgi:O-antigen ligase
MLEKTFKFLKINSSDINKSISFYLLLILPVALITGPLIPELIINLICVFYLTDLFKKKIIFSENNKIILLMIFTSVYCLVINLINNLNNELIFKNLFYLRFFIFFFSIGWVLNNKEKIEKLLLILIITILIIIFDLMFQYTFSFNLLGFDALDNYKKGMMFSETSDVISIKRYSGFFGNELIAGSYLSKFFIICIIYFLIKKKSLFKIFFFTILVFFGIFLSGERASLLTFLFALTLLSTLNKSYFKYLFFISLFFLFIFIKVNTTLAERYLKDEPFNIIFSYKSYENKEFAKKLSESNHGILFKNSINLIKLKPFFGFGYKGFKRNCILNEKIISSTENKICSTHPHNYYLDIVINFGFIGLSLFVILFFIIAFEIFKFSKQFNKITIIIYLVLFIPITSGSFFNNWISIIIWLNLGLLFKLSQLNYFDFNFKNKS